MTGNVKKQTMSIFGTGPLLFVLTFLYCLITYYITQNSPETFLIKGMDTYLYVMASINLIIGIPLYIFSAITISKNFKKGKLMTTGPFKFVRHPLYSSMILLVLPGILMFFKSWLLMSAQTFMYLLFKVLIKKEENYLEQTFGEEYKKYKATTRAIMPNPLKILKG